MANTCNRCGSAACLLESPTVCRHTRRRREEPKVQRAVVVTEPPANTAMEPPVKKRFGRP